MKDEPIDTKQAITNKALFDALYNFSLESADILRKKHESDAPLTCLSGHQAQIDEFGTVTSDFKTQPDTDATFKSLLLRVLLKENPPQYSKFIQTHWDDLAGLSSYKNCVEEMEKDERFSMHLGSIVGAMYEAFSQSSTDYLVMYLERLFRLCRGIRVEEKESEQVFASLESFIRGNKVEYLGFAALWDFFGYDPPIEITSSARIVNTTQSRLYQFFGVPGGLQMPLSPLNWDFSWVLEFHGFASKLIEQNPKKKINLPGDIEPLSKLEEITSAMKLWKHGLFHNALLHVFIVDWIRPAGLSGGPYPTRPRIWMPQVSYQLMPDELSQFRAHCEFFLTTEKPESARIAIDRFSSAYNRHNVRDQLIDYIIAFEALLLEGKSELKEKLARRVAIYLEDDIHKRIIIQKMIQEAYDIRSSLVHGTGVDSIEKILRKRKMKIHRFVYNIERLTRRCINKYIISNRNGLNKSDIINKIDLVSLGFDIS